jgi:hypothetical protein
MPKMQDITREEITIDVKVLLGPPIERPEAPAILAQKDPAFVFLPFFNTIKSSLLDTPPIGESSPEPKAHAPLAA